jgi:hypothetical protein
MRASGFRGAPSVLILGLAAPAVADLRGGAVPLSEHEQRLLEQMEKALYAEDPKLASTLRGSHLRPTDRRRLILGIFGILVGLGLLLAGVMTPIWGFGVIGFLVMLIGAWYALHRPATARPSGPGSTSTGRPNRRSAKPSKASFMDRLEQRWDRRRDSQ